MSGQRTRLQLVCVVGVMLLVAAACGQKPGVADQAATGQLSGGTQLQLPEGTELDAEGNLIDSETGEIIATADELAEQNPSLADGGTGDTGDTSTDSTDDTTGNTDSPSTDAPSSGDDDFDSSAPGVTDKVIKIGIHAPITGAAPVPSQSFQKGKDLYWNYLKKTDNLIFGRTVEAVFRNDNYNPSQAVSMCREMVEKEHVFLLVGVAGTDQIQACARYAASVGVPYLSAGVTEIGLDGLNNYFANWMTYPEQGPLLADLLTTRLGAKDEVNGMLRFNTPTFQDAHDAFIDAMEAKGAEVAYDRAISKTAGASEAQTIATEMRTQGVDNVFVLTSPTFFIQLAQAAVNQQYKPQWTGVGLSMTIDTVANVACRNNGSINNARFLGPFPAYVDSDKYDPQFRKEGGTDDIMFGLWASSKLLEGYFRAAGANLTRGGFVDALQNASIKTGILPDVKFSPDDHFGGTSMHLLRADCANNRWVTEEDFVSDFK